MTSDEPRQNILVVEDEDVLRQTLKYNLEKEGYSAQVASEGYEALEWFEKDDFDLILLDVMLPGLSGFELCQIIRRQNRSVPIILLTARRDELDKVTGLDLGADDYVTKPFSLRELMARIRAALRRAREGDESRAAAVAQLETVSPDAPPRESAMQAGDVRLDRARYEVRAGTGQIAMTTSRKEFDLLHLLAAARGAVVTRELAMEKVWGYDFAGDDRTLDVHIAWLRQKLAKAGATAHITTVRGVGYRLDTEPVAKGEDHG